MEPSKKDFYTLIVSAVLFYVSSQVVLPIFPLYLMERGASAFELGLIISLRPIVTILSKFLLSPLIDRSGRWPMLLTAMLGQFLSLLSYSLVPVIIWFYPIRIFQAVCLALFSPTAISIIYDLSPSDRRGDFVGRYLTSYGVASMVGPLFCSVLCSYSTSYSGIFLFSSILSLIGLTALLILLPSDKIKGRTFSNISLESREPAPLGSLRKLALSRSGIVLSYVRVAFSSVNSFVTTIFSVYASEVLLYHPAEIALLFMVKGITNTLFRVPSGLLTDKIGRIKPLFTAYSLLTLTFFLLSELRDFLLLVLVMALYGLSHAMRAVTEWSLLGDVTPREISGLSTAYFSMMFDVGGGVGSIFAGATLTLLGAPLIFRLGSAILASGLAVILSLGKERMKIIR
ncbi:MFS transporter [Candidatus Bathyarchaeota archaeon]|nr:MFS transporter [Candidatus Bathyarchaeota archaeon]